MTRTPARTPLDHEMRRATDTALRLDRTETGSYGAGYAEGFAQGLRRAREMLQSHVVGEIVWGVNDDATVRQATPAVNGETT